MTDSQPRIQYERVDTSPMESAFLPWVREQRVPDGTPEAVEQAAEAIHRALSPLGSEAPIMVYNAQGYGVWLAHAAIKVLDAIGYDALVAENKRLDGVLCDIAEMLNWSPSDRPPVEDVIVMASNALSEAQIVPQKDLSDG